MVGVLTMHRHNPTLSASRHFPGRSGCTRRSLGWAALLPFLVSLTLGWATSAALQAEELDAESVTLPPGAASFEDFINTPIVIGASRFEQKTTEAPSSVTLLTAADIKHYGYRTLADILESVPGLYVTYDRKYHFLGVRGFNRGDQNSRTLVLLNGHRLNNNLSDGVDLGTAFLLDVDLIERVEVIRGPGSALYGNNAFFGVINVITRQGRDLAGGEITGEAASYDTYSGRLSYGYQFQNEFEMLLSGTLFDSEGPDNSGVRRLDDDTFGSGFASLRYRDLTLEGGYIQRDKANPTAQYATVPNDPRFRSIDERGYASLRYQRLFTNVVEVMARAYYDRNRLEVFYPLIPGAPADRELQDGQRWGAETQLTKRIADRHTLTLGGEYWHDFDQEFAYYPVPGLPPAADIDLQSRSHGVYAQGDFALLDNLRLSAGLRYDQYSDLDPTFNPRLALIYNPFPATTFKAIGGTAYRAPNFLERMLSNGILLDPETITTYELVYEQGIGQHLRSSVAGFYNRIDDLITFDNGRYQNLDAADALGLELSLEGTWAAGLRTRLSYTWQQVEDRTTGQRLSDSPHHLAKANLALPLYRDKIFAGIEFQYTSSRKTMRSTSLGGTEPGNDAAGYALVNLTLFSRELVKNLELSASIYNLLDKRYSDPSTPQHLQDLIGQYGRTFRVKLLYHF